MTPKQFSSLTLADLEAIAGRLEKAARTIRDAQSLLSGGAPASPGPQAAPTPLTMLNPHGFTPAELAERARLLTANRPEDYPADIASALKGDA